MSYTPTNWKNGDKITSEKLNKIENAIRDNSEKFTVTGNLNTDDNIHFSVTNVSASVSDIIQAIDRGERSTSCSHVGYRRTCND